MADKMFENNQVSIIGEIVSCCFHIFLLSLINKAKFATNLFYHNFSNVQVFIESFYKIK